MKEKHKILPEGLNVMILALSVNLILSALFGLYGLIFMPLTLIAIFFFRDPARVIVKDDNYLVSPADGVVADIEIVKEEEFIHGQALRIGIFLSVFNVHLNRSPYFGVVVHQKFTPGKFRMAFAREASTDNQSNSIGMNTVIGPLLIKQITGFIARKIFSWVEPGDEIEYGQRIGLIRFGSRTELYIPINRCRVLVKKGDRVSGGVTCIAEVIRNSSEKGKNEKL